MNADKIHTLLLSQDQRWVSALYGALWQHGFAPLTIAPTGDAALDLVYQTTPRLVLIDIGLPDGNTIDLCVEMLLAHPALKVVLLTETDAEPPLALLHAGVSGSIRRDFPQTVLPGLLTYILSGGTTFSQTIVETALADAWSTPQRESLLTLGTLRIDLARRQILYGGRRIRLTPREFSLLTCLARNLDRVVTFDQLLNEAWGYDTDDGTPAQVRLYVARLRRKLLEDAQTPDFILTERGIGYRLHSEVLHSALRRPEQRLPTKTSAHLPKEEPTLI